MTSKIKILFIFTKTILLLSISMSVFSSESIGIVAIASDASSTHHSSLNINQDILEGDLLQTDKNGSLTILFVDESILTLGPKSKAKVIAFSYEKQGQKDHSEIRILAGTFNYLPGLILDNGNVQTLINNTTTQTNTNSLPINTSLTLDEQGITTAQAHSPTLDVDIARDVQFDIPILNIENIAPTLSLGDLETQEFEIITSNTGTSATAGASASTPSTPTARLIIAID